MEFLTDYGLFLAKTVTFVIAVAVIIVIGVAAGMKNKGIEKGSIVVTKINDQFSEVFDIMRSAILDEKAYKDLKKQEKKSEKEEEKQKKAKKDKDKDKDNESDEARKRAFVTEFNGDIKATATDELREVVTAILEVAEPQDEVILKLESPGGMVHGYGLAASQLARITAKDIPLTVCVDKVAASGGYMMACVAQKIITAPFAIIGSIGVLAQLPNFHRLLKKHDIDYELLTAGKYKRTLTMLGENTEEGREKFKEELEDTHVLFKEFITKHRPQVDIETVATGEIWFGQRAQDQKLVDEIATSDEYLTRLYKDVDIFEVKYEQKKSIAEKLGVTISAGIEQAVVRVLNKLNTRQLF